MLKTLGLTAVVLLGSACDDQRSSSNIPAWRGPNWSSPREQNDSTEKQYYRSAHSALFSSEARR